MKPWLIYARVSTEEQVESGISLDAQLTACRSYAIARGWQIADEIMDRGESAATLKRPGIQKIINLMQAGDVAGVIAWRLDRLTRSIRDLLTLLDLTKDERAGIVSVTESLDTTSPMGRFVVHLLVLIAQWERETIGHRTKAAMDHAKNAGFWTGGSVPTGCAVVADGPRRRLVKTKVGEQLKTTWQKLIDGQSLAQIADELNRINIPHEHKNKPTPWTPVSVRRLIVSKLVTGVLVDAVTQAKAIAVLSERATPARCGRKIERAGPPSIISGVLRCPSCNRAMTCVQAHGRSKAYRYFRCTGRTKRTCAQKDLRAEPLEQAVIDGLVVAMAPGGEYHQRLSDALIVARQGADQAKIEQIQLIARGDKLRSRINELALSDNATDGLAPAIKSLGAELNQSERRLAEISAQIAASQVDELSAALAVEQMTKGITHLAAANDEQKRTVIQSLVASVVITTEKINLELYAPEKNEPLADTPAVRRVSTKWGPSRHGVRTVVCCVLRDIKARCGRRLG